MSDSHVAKRIARVEQNLIPWHRRGTGGDERRTIAERMAHYRVPGVSVAVVDNGVLQWATGYGALATNDPRPVTTTTLFQAASISKPVTALAVLRLVTRGLLDLDADVHSYIKGWSLPYVGPWQPRVSLRHLLSHTGGVTVNSFPGYPHGQARPTLLQVLLGEEPANTASVGVDAIPGTGHRYSGGAYCIVQQLLVELSGVPFLVLMRDLVFDPLGMTNSTFGQPLPGDLQHVAAVAHRSGAQPIPNGSHIYPEMAAAGLWTTASDVARFLVALQRAHAGAADAVMPQALAIEMLSPQIDEEIDLGMPLGGIGDGARHGKVGLGIFLDSSGTAARMGHGGINEGFRCHMIGDIVGGQGAVVMTNSDDGAPLMLEIVQAIADEYGWPAYPRATSPVIDVPASTLQSFAGVYVLRPGFKLTVLSREDGLWLQAGEQQPLRLAATSETSFVAEAIGAALSFVRDERDDSTFLELRQSTGVRRARRQAD